MTLRLPWKQLYIIINSKQSTCFSRKQGRVGEKMESGGEKRICFVRQTLMLALVGH